MNVFECSGIHKVWHEFIDEFGNPDDWDMRDQDTKVAMMDEIEKWAAKYPDDVFINGIDDSYHASSDIVFILHRNEHGENWGTSALVITQCDSQSPCLFFMYPGHLTGILKTLAHINDIKDISDE